MLNSSRYSRPLGAKNRLSATKGLAPAPRFSATPVLCCATWKSYTWSARLRLQLVGRCGTADRGQAVSAAEQGQGMQSYFFSTACLVCAFQVLASTHPGFFTLIFLPCSPRQTLYPHPTSPTSSPLRFASCHNHYSRILARMNICGM